jgi:hypothetical protein
MRRAIAAQQRHDVSLGRPGSDYSTVTLLARFRG